MSPTQSQINILVQALCEIRVLLAAYLGPHSEGDRAVHAAAHLAYGLHNQALAVLDGKQFDAADAIAVIRRVDRLVHENFAAKFEKCLVDDNA